MVHPVRTKRIGHWPTDRITFFHREHIRFHSNPERAYRLGSFWVYMRCQRDNHHGGRKDQGSNKVPPCASGSGLVSSDHRSGSSFFIYYPGHSGISEKEGCPHFPVSCPRCEGFFPVMDFKFNLGMVLPDFMTRLIPQKSGSIEK